MLTDVVRVMNFSWHAPTTAEEAERIVSAARERSTRRWRIKDLRSRYVERNARMLTGFVELSWTYGPVHGGRPDDGRKFVERVLNDALGRPLLQDLRESYPDVIVVQEADSPSQDFLRQFPGG